MRKRMPRFLAWLLLMLPTWGFAADPGYSVVATPISSATSGTLFPFSISVDGQQLFATETSAESLRINGETITALKGRKKPFFHRTVADTLLIEYVEVGTTESHQIEFALPRLITSRMVNGIWEGQVSEGVKTVAMDETPVKFSEGTVTWALTAGKENLDRPHVLELKVSRKKPGRLYNLEFSKLGGSEKKREVASETLSGTLSHAPRNFSLLSFETSMIAAFQVQARRGSSVSPKISWNPSVQVFKALSVQGDLGFSPLRAVTGEVFLMTEYELRLSLDWGRLRWQAGGGFQTWKDHGGTKPMISMRGGYLWSKSPLAELEGIFLGWSTLYYKGYQTHVIELALGFRFDS